jgi:hypothetical protein
MTGDTPDAPAPRAAAPALAVVLVAGPQRGRGSRCLESLVAQADDVSLEVLLLDLAGDQAEPLAGASHRCVRCLPAHDPETGALLHYGELRARGVQEARADVVAFIEEHCLAHAGWARALVEAHHGPWAGVGCEVHNANPGRGLSDFIHLIGYGPFAPPAPAGPAHGIPGQNSSYKRDALLALGEDLPKLLVADVLLQRALRKAGHRMALAPDARMSHLNEQSTTLLGAGSYHYHRYCFAARAEVSGWRWWRRLAFAAASVAVPLYRPWRELQAYRKRARHGARDFRRALPGIVLMSAYAVAGIVVGLLFGAGEAAHRFTWYEVTAPRADDDDPHLWSSGR